MIGIGIPISHRRMPRMNSPLFSNVSENVSRLTRFRTAHGYFTVWFAIYRRRPTRV